MALIGIKPDASGKILRRASMVDAGTPAIQALRGSDVDASYVTVDFTPDARTSGGAPSPNAAAPASAHMHRNGAEGMSHPETIVALGRTDPAMSAAYSTATHYRNQSVNAASGAVLSPHAPYTVYYGTPVPLVRQASDDTAITSREGRSSAPYSEQALSPLAAAPSANPMVATMSPGGNSRRMTTRDAVAARNAGVVGHHPSLRTVDLFQLRVAQQQQAQLQRQAAETHRAAGGCSHAAKSAEAATSTIYSVPGGALSLGGVLGANIHGQDSTTGVETHSCESDATADSIDGLHLVDSGLRLRAPADGSHGCDSARREPDADSGDVVSPTSPLPRLQQGAGAAPSPGDPFANLAAILQATAERDPAMMAQLMQLMLQSKLPGGASMPTSAAAAGAPQERSVSRRQAAASRATITAAKAEARTEGAPAVSSAAIELSQRRAATPSKVAAGGADPAPQHIGVASPTSVSAFHSPAPAAAVSATTKRAATPARSLGVSAALSTTVPRSPDV